MNKKRPNLIFKAPFRMHSIKLSVKMKIGKKTLKLKLVLSLGGSAHFGAKLIAR